MKNLNFTKDIFVDTILINDEILIKKLKTAKRDYRFSIILSSYRKKENLKNIIENLLLQKEQNFEILIIDDLMTNEIENIYELFFNYENINYIKKQLGSRSSAKNIAISYSKGEYIIFIEEEVKSLNQDYLLNFEKKIKTKYYDIIALKDIIFDYNRTGIEFLNDEILRKKEKIESCLAFYAIKKQFLNLYLLQFSTDILEGENLYFKIKLFNIVKNISYIDNISFIKKEGKRLNDNIIKNNEYILRKLKMIEKIEKYLSNIDNNDYLKYLCGYLYLETLKYVNDIKLEKSILLSIAEREEYFKKDSFFKRFILKISPKIFIKKYL